MHARKDPSHADLGAGPRRLGVDRGLRRGGGRLCVGGRSLGTIVVTGFGTQDYGQVLAGGILVAALCLVSEGLLAIVQHLMTPRGLRALARDTSDDPTRYRIAAEVEEWKLKDPIARVKAYLARGGLADQAFFDEVDAEAGRLAAHVRQACLTMPDPDPDDIFAFAYREPHPLVEEERAWFADYRASFETEPRPELTAELPTGASTGGAR